MYSGPDPAKMAGMSQDHYATLGLKKGASDDQIAKAYRELARKYHPDLNQDDNAAKQKFQQVQQAFDVLNDPKKREMYDRFGPGFEQMGGGGGPGGGGQGGGGQGPFGSGGPFGGSGPFGGGGGQPDVNLDELFGGGAAGGGGFADIFKQFSSGSRGGRRGGAPPRKGADIEHEVTVPFATAINGGQIAISIRRANGKEETITAKAPAGIEDGKKIRLRGQGDPGTGGDGDLLITVRVAPHPVFTRRGNRLDVVAPITLAEALRGAKIDVPTPHGAVTLTVPPGTSSGKRLRVREHGVRPKSAAAGDLYVELQIVLPSDLSESDREQIAEMVDDRPRHPRSELRW